MKIKDVFVLVMVFSILVFSLGMHLNFKVVLSNGCRMPVLNFPYKITGDYFFISDVSTANYTLFSDVHSITTESFYIYYSIGDVFQLSGGFLFIVFFSLWLSEVRRCR